MFFSELIQICLSNFHFNRNIFIAGITKFSKFYKRNKYKWENETRLSFDFNGPYKNTLLKEFKIISDEGLAWDPNALNTYNLLSGYNALMEGDPTQSLDYYSKIPTQTIDDNNYHRYFKALALKATGKQEESKDLMVKLANDNFATWQNAVVKNLAKAQIKTNL